MTRAYEKETIFINGVELTCRFERAVVLGQPGEPKYPYENDGGVSIRGDLRGVIAAFKILEENQKTAFRWQKNGDHPLDGKGTFTDPETGEEHLCEGRVVRYYRRPDDDGQNECTRCGDIMHNHGWIDSGGHGQNVCPGDFVVSLGDDRYAVEPGPVETPVVEEVPGENGQWRNQDRRMG